MLAVQLGEEVAAIELLLPLLSWFIFFLAGYVFVVSFLKWHHKTPVSACPNIRKMCKLIPTFVPYAKGRYDAVEKSKSKENTPTHTHTP